jgi:hypothetical protein
MSTKKDRKRRARKQQAPIQYLKNPFFTPRLNAGLKTIADDATRPDTHRVWAWMVRSSWGNWCAHAVKKDPRLPAAENFDPASEIGVSFDPTTLGRIGSGLACPFCRKIRELEETIPDDWPWHLHCMAIVYAADAIACGTPAEHAWAGSVAHDPAITKRLCSDAPTEGRLQ